MAATTLGRHSLTVADGSDHQSCSASLLECDYHFGKVATRSYALVLLMIKRFAVTEYLD